MQVTHQATEVISLGPTAWAQVSVPLFEERIRLVPGVRRPRQWL